MNCQVCEAKTTDTYLCRDHNAELHDMLRGLPKWIEHLTEAAIGQTRMGSGGSRGNRAEPFTGDDEVLPTCKCGHPEHDERQCPATIPADELAPEHACLCAEYRPVEDQAKMRARLLRAGGINARASKLADKVRKSLATIIHDLSEQQRVPTPVIDSAQLMAIWLYVNRAAIAASDHAGHWYTDILDQVHAIETAINRPRPHRFCGPCPAYVEDPQTKHTRPCATQITARHDAIEVTCPKCHTTHNVERLIARLFNDIEHQRFTIRELVDVVLPKLEESVPRRTLYDWANKGKLKPRGYRRPDGRRVITRHSDQDQAEYRLADVRKLRAEGKARV